MDRKNNGVLDSFQGAVSFYKAFPVMTESGLVRIIPAILIGKGGTDMAAFERVLSGIPEMDQALDNIRLGDNVVWRVSSLDEFHLFLDPYLKNRPLR